MKKTGKNLILASKSLVRRDLLKQAGLSFDIHPAELDERGIIAAHWVKDVPVEVIAMDLARQKAAAVSLHHPGALVIGADQILMHKGQLVDKARDERDARHTLKNLQGSSHRLISSVAVAENGVILWENVDAASLVMRPLDDEAIEDYCIKAGTALTDYVGGYALEGIGLWLFEKVEGDYFTILGLPLPSLLGFLRTWGYGP